MTALALSHVPSLPSLRRALALNWSRVAAYSGAFSVHVIIALMLLVPPLAMQMQRFVAEDRTDVTLIEPPPIEKPEPKLPQPPAKPKKVEPAPSKPQPVLNTPVPNPVPFEPAAPTNTIAPPSDSPALQTPVDSGAVDTAPSALSYGTQTRIPYPPIALRNRAEGKVVLRVLVGTDGSVEQIEIEHTSGSRDLDRAAREAVMKWKFKPGMRGGTAYSGWALVPIVFTLPL
ncbi:MAG: TonB family protein [Rudaea sp.]|uniref:energy transducer TonB n=1 Tax=unclassified Rudaea TaxID=2627037 RepID=UPI0010F49274|nr:MULTISPECIES: energy transducer TonB [unclassified Rudaea]MBN8887094.1 TonB family protein [Rudaea sp.]MBR0347186.1 TonB family protein [Rudaea sp.]